MILRAFEKCFEIYDLDPTCFLIAPRLAWQAVLKRMKKVDVLTDINMLLMVGKGIRERICNAIH